MQRTGAAGIVSRPNAAWARLRPLISFTLSRVMEHLVRFEIDATRYYVWRQGEWILEASVGSVEGETVNLDCEIPYRDLPSMAKLQRFPITSEEGLSLRMVRTAGGHDDINFSLDALEGSVVMLRFELPEGVQLMLMDDDGDAAAG